MKTPNPLLLAGLLVCFAVPSVHAQLQWYQNQDGSNGTYNPTIATQVVNLNSRSVAACYYWSTNGDQVTWKISKTNESGVETRTAFFTGSGTQTEIRRGHSNALYVLTRSFPVGLDPEYKLYKLDTNLVIRKQYQITFPGTFAVNTINAFETDIWDNVYVAGDGQYPDGPGFHPASFVVKANKNLEWKWNYVDSVQTTYSRIHISSFGIVQVIQDYYGYFPDIHVTRLTAQGHLAGNRTITTSAGRMSLQTIQDPDDNIYLYGGQSEPSGLVDMYLYKLSGFNGQTVFFRKYYNASDIQTNDLKADDQGNLFSLVTLFDSIGNQISRISRIRAQNGQLNWNKSYQYNADSCVFNKLVMDASDRFYVVGNQQSGNGFSRAMALRLKKSGQNDASFPAPDSVRYRKVHGLTDGITDRANRLIAIGTTWDIDPVTQQSNYCRSFAVEYGSNSNGCNNKSAVTDTFTPQSELEIVSDAGDAIPDAMIQQKASGNEIPAAEHWMIYPNPASDVLHLVNLDPQVQQQVNVYTVTGMRVQQLAVSGRSMDVQTNTLPSGIYMLSVQSGNNLPPATVKFVVRH